MPQATLKEIASDLQFILEKILDRFRPSKVILFGSYASGDATSDSDVDLLVVAPEAPNWREAHSFRTDLQSNSPIRLHLVFMRDEQFRETQDVVGGLAFPASRTGVVLYDQKS